MEAVISGDPVRFVRIDYIYCKEGISWKKYRKNPDLEVGRDLYEIIYLFSEMTKVKQNNVLAANEFTCK